MINLVNVKFNNLELINRAVEGSELQLKTNLQYKVDYIEDSNSCIGIAIINIEDNNDENEYPFLISLEAMAKFDYTDDVDKDDIDTLSFEQLFPYIRVAITNLTSLSGMPGLIIPTMKLQKKAEENSKIN